MHGVGLDNLPKTRLHLPAMVIRLCALPVLIIVTAAVTAPVTALADHGVGISQAKKAVRSTLDAEFTNGGGVKKGSLDLTCKRDGELVRCGIRMQDRRDRRWCGHSSVKPGHQAGKPITITHYNVRMANCGA